jgi:hypothetical protein
LAQFTVHLATTEPRPAWTAWKAWESGLLTVHQDHAEFAGRTGTRLLIDNVLEVSQPSRGQLRREHDFSWPVNTWIRVRYRASGQAHTVFVNDARLWGLAHYVSHKAMRRALDSLVAAERRD